MHIHYMTKIQAKKALSKDGRIFGGCMKIGVVPCTEKVIMLVYWHIVGRRLGILYTEKVILLMYLHIIGRRLGILYIEKVILLLLYCI